MQPQVLGSIIDPSSPLFFSQGFVFLIIKIFFLIGFGLYAIFAFALVRQVSLMTRTFFTAMNMIFSVFALIHLFFALGIWLFAFLTL